MKNNIRKAETKKVVNLNILQITRVIGDLLFIYIFNGSKTDIYLNVLHTNLGKSTVVEVMRG